MRPRSTGAEKAARIREMVRKEILQIRRDPRLFRLIFIAPIIQLVIFGYAVSTDVRHTATWVVDHDQSRESRGLIDAFTSSGYFRIAGRSPRSGDLVGALDRGRAVMGVEIPPGFARALGRGEARVQLVFDGTNSNLATVAMGYAERIIQDYGASSTPSFAGLPIDLRDRAWFNPDLASRNYNVPAVLGMVVMLICLLLTSLAVVREREIGTLDQLRVSPLSPGELIAGKTIPFAIIGLIDLTLVTLVARLWFHVPFEGSGLLFLGGSLLYLLTALGLGLLISTVSSTQREAFMTTFLIFMPSILLSGFMFPLNGIPAVFAGIAQLNPMTHYLVVVRGVFLKGAGLDVLWPRLLVLAGMGITLLWLAARRFRKA